MRRLTGRSIGLLVAPLLVAAVGTVATATSAAACQNVVSCTTTNHDGNLHAGVSYITISVNGGNYASHGGLVEVPNRVPPPCWYSKGRSGAEMYADSNDPYYYALAHHVGENHDDLFPPGVDEHKDQPGNWWDWQCDSGNFDGSIQDFFKYVDQWAASHGPIFLPPNVAPPQPPVPPEILMGLAVDAMNKTVRMPVVNFNPAARSFVRLDTWMWFDPAAWQPVSVTASGGGNSVTVTATPGKVGVSGVPADSTVRTGCAGGGRAYSAGGSTDCLINFNRSSGGQPGQQWHFQVSLTWNVTATGAALQGPPTVTRTEDEALTVLEAQAVAGNPRNDD